MDSRNLKALLTLLAITLESAWCFECDQQATICETTLVIHHKLSMMHEVHRKVYPHKGKLYKYDVSTPDQSIDVPMSEVITGDGWEQERLVTVANGSLPGPPIIAYVGQRLKINVINELQSDSVTIHWHGLPQYDTPWMDGVAFVTQCPILPGQSFTYEFMAEPKGTYWYHSHVGSQRTKGLNGPLIIRERRPAWNVAAEHIMTVQGWNHDWDSDMDHQKMVYGVFENRTLLPTSKSLDGTFFSRFKLTSALINGRGRYYFDMEADQHNYAPLEVFKVTSMEQYRFRVINVGGLYPFRVSVDGHNITLIASDGYEFVPEVAESFVISPGERYDFILYADQPIGNYWVRAESLELDNMHKALAILRYNTAAVEDPTSSRQQCSSTSECVVVNCPFSVFPSAGTRCKTVDQLRSATNGDPAPTHTGSDGEFTEHFLNFAFPGTTFTPGSVNGRKFKNPQVSALTQPLEIETACDKADCGEEKLCECTYSLPIKHNDVVQFVFLNMGKGRGWAHPIHLHGYSFYVVKMGFPVYNSTSGEYISQNADIDCRGSGIQDQSFCNDATWSDPNWLGGNVPDIELDNALRKDTIIIPSGGYAVVRIKADNPGVWIMHCHIELHSTDGMAMLINNSFGLSPSAPRGFPQCRGFPSNFVESVMTTPPDITAPRPDTDVTARRRNTEDDAYTMKIFWVTVSVLGIIMLLMVAYILHLHKEVKTLKKTSSSIGQSTETLGVSVTNVAFKA
ncbi:uncharacterized protein [Argopecten irradians]|uniref:uncharacterized protein n=1 Tax=Argopecten irradians TaxID=31199 RepID=UPI00371AF4C3